MMKENILGYDVNNFSVDDCTEELIHQLMVEGRKSWFACFNPHSHAITLKDAMFSRALKAADWLVPDGVGVVLASRLLGGTIQNRVTGSDVFAGLHTRLNTVGNMSVFFLGATEESLALIRQSMAYDYPDIKVAGTFSPPFKDEFSEADNRMMIEVINKARPDVLWVGMSAPKQEKWIYLNKGRLDVKFIAAVGAVFDFYAGNIKREKDSWFVNHGLEWLLRLVQEPGRLWRRTFVSAPIFFWLVFKQRLKMFVEQHS
ncbi:MAG: WecB/TagA/CpsF family glycosyltransferase [Deltaproteobacteria bacterium]|nr:WecB/TagA/CpsF family glycosyltransferase [Deltaproteobacteria bacterium]